jgi:hypothetical protein
MTNTDNAHNKKPLSDLSLWPGFCETLFLVLYKKSWYQFKFLLQDLLLMTKRAGLLFFFGKKDRIAPGEHQKEKKENVENVEKRIHPHLKKKISFLALFGPNQPKKKKNFFFFLLHPDDHAVRTRSSCSFSSASDGTPLFRGRRIISWKKDNPHAKKTIHEGEPKKKKKKPRRTTTIPRGGGGRLWCGSGKRDMGHIRDRGRAKEGSGGMAEK